MNRLPPSKNLFEWNYHYYNWFGTEFQNCLHIHREDCAIELDRRNDQQISYLFHQKVQAISVHVFQLQKIISLAAHCVMFNLCISMISRVKRDLLNPLIFRIIDCENNSEQVLFNKVFSLFDFVEAGHVFHRSQNT